mgnify:FL=1|jgi:hypothetical protein
MNSLKKTGAAFLLLFAITSCIPHEAPDPDMTPGNLISISGSMEEPGTRTTLSEGIHTNWVSGDYIGLFSDQVNSGYDNSPYRAQNSASTSEFTGEMEWGSASTSHTFYAYYPYDGDASTATAVPFYLSSVQFQSGANSTSHITGENDFLIAEPVTVLSPPEAGAISPAVGLTFNHLFSLIEIQVIGTGSLSRVELLGTAPLTCGSGTVDITQNPETGNYSVNIPDGQGNTYAAVQLNSSVYLSDVPASIYMLVLPGTHGTISIHFNIDGRELVLEKTPPAGGFIRGQKYVVTADRISMDDRGPWYS